MIILVLRSIFVVYDNSMHCAVDLPESNPFTHVIDTHGATEHDIKKGNSSTCWARKVQNYQGLPWN